MIAAVHRLDDRISFERDGGALHVVNRLPLLPLPALFYLALSLVTLAAGAALGVLGVVFLVPLALWVLFLAVWCLGGREEIRVDRETLSAQRRLGPIGLSRRVFERDRIGRMWAEGFDRPWWKVPNNNLLATLEYHGLIRGCVAFEYGDRTRRIGAKLNSDEAERLLELLR